MNDAQQNAYQLSSFLSEHSMSIEERFPGCGFVYYDEHSESGSESGSVYWNLEKDSNGKETLRLAAQHGSPSLETLATMREALRLWMKRS